jgi:hypothetical protein
MKIKLEQQQWISDSRALSSGQYWKHFKGINITLPLKIYIQKYNQTMRL